MCRQDVSSIRRPGQAVDTPRLFDHLSKRLRRRDIDHMQISAVLTNRKALPVWRDRNGAAG